MSEAYLELNERSEQQQTGAVAGTTVVRDAEFKKWLGDLNRDSKAKAGPDGINMQLVRSLASYLVMAPPLLQCHGQMECQDSLTSPKSTIKDVQMTPAYDPKPGE